MVKSKRGDKDSNQTLRKSRVVSLHRKDGQWDSVLAEDSENMWVKFKMLQSQSCWSLSATDDEVGSGVAVLTQGDAFSMVR